MVLHSFYWRYEGSQVNVTGDFDEWKGETKMQKTDDGHFVKVIDLPANTKIYYKFIVDGRWTIDGEALKEGEGQTENNYILTGAAHQNDTAIVSSSNATSSDGASSALPALGAGAAYVAPITDTTTEKTLGVTAEDVPAVETTTPNAPAAIEHSDETSSKQAFSPVDATPGPALSSSTAETETSAEPSLNATELATETKEKATKALEIAGGAIAGGVAAGAAALGLSKAGSSEKAATSTTESSATAASKATVQEVSGTSTPVTSKVSQVAQSGKLEQAAVAAATAAATNAYNASGLSGLSGAGSPVSSIAKNGDLGFTGIGTAVNTETGVVGTSKIIQGVKDVSPSEDTQTAKLSGNATNTLLESQENGARVEKIGEHAVLAEVGIGGAAIGTAVVTDSTITDAKALAIPASAAEHLTPVAAESAAVPATAAEAVKSEVAAPLSRDVATPAVAVAPVVPSQAAPAPVSKGPVDSVAAPAAVDSRPITSETKATSESYATAKTSTKTAATAPETPSKAATPAATPARAAAAAAAAGQSAHSPRQPSEAPSKDTTATAEDGKKKRGLFKRMKNIFNAKK